MKKVIIITMLLGLFFNVYSLSASAQKSSATRGKVNVIIPNATKLGNSKDNIEYLREDSQRFLKSLRPSDLPSSSISPKNDVVIERGRFGFLDEMDFSQESGVEGGTDSGVSNAKPVINIEVKVGSADAKTDYDNMELAWQSLASGHYEVAMIYYRDAYKKEPNNLQALFGLATAYHKSGQEVRAKSLYLQLLKKDRRHQGAINNLLSIIAKESLDVALPELERLQKQSPDYPAIPAHIGIIMMKKGEYDSAFRHMQRAVMLEPDNAIYRYHLAVLLDMMGQAELAIDLYNRVLLGSRNGQSLPESPIVISKRIEFLRGKVAEYKKLSAENEE